MRKFVGWKVLVAAAVLALCAAVGLAACKPDSVAGGEGEYVGFDVPARAEVSLKQTYTVPVFTVTHTSGAAVTVTYTVTRDGAAVDASAGSFVAEKPGDYIVTYTAAAEGYDPAVKTLTVVCADTGKPVVTLGQTDEFYLEGDLLVLDGLATVTDDSGESLTPQYKLYDMSHGEGTAIELTGLTYEFERNGDFLLTASATDSAGNTGTAECTLTVSALNEVESFSGEHILSRLLAGQNTVREEQMLLTPGFTTEAIGGRAHDGGYVHYIMPVSTESWATRFAFYAEPRLTKDLYQTCLSSGYTAVQIPVYVTGVDAPAVAKLWMNTNDSALGTDYVLEDSVQPDTWTYLSVPLDVFIEHYDSMVNECALFCLEADNTQHGYEVYIGGIYAVKPLTAVIDDSFATEPVYYVNSTLDVSGFTADSDPAGVAFEYFAVAPDETVIPLDGNGKLKLSQTGTYTLTAVSADRNYAYMQLEREVSVRPEDSIVTDELPEYIVGDDVDLTLLNPQVYNIDTPVAGYTFEYNVYFNKDEIDVTDANTFPANEPGTYTVDITATAADGSGKKVYGSVSVDIDWRTRPKYNELEGFGSERAVADVLAGENNARRPEQLPTDYVPSEIGGRQPAEGGFLRIEMCKTTEGAVTYLRVFVKPRQEKAAYLKLQEEGYDRIIVPVYYTGTDKAGQAYGWCYWENPPLLGSIRPDTWTELEIPMDYFIDNYDEMLNYYGLFSLFVDNTESGYTAYVDGIYAIKAREPATKTEVESFNDRRALSGVLAGVNNARATEQLNKDYIPTPVGDRDPSGGGFLKLDMPQAAEWGQLRTLVTPRQSAEAYQALLDEGYTKVVIPVLYTGTTANGVVNAIFNLNPGYGPVKLADITPDTWYELEVELEYFVEQFDQMVNWDAMLSFDIDNRTSGYSVYIDGIFVVE